MSNGYSNKIERTKIQLRTLLLQNHKRKATDIGKPQWSSGHYARLPEDRTPELTYDENEFYATDVFTDYALEFIKQGIEKKKPFFLYLAHSSPHFPLHAPAETRDKYLDRYCKGWDALRRERFQRQKESGLATDSWKFTERSDVPKDGNGQSGQNASRSRRIINTNKQ